MIKANLEIANPFHKDTEDPSRSLFDANESLSINKTFATSLTIYEPMNLFSVIINRYCKIYFPNG